MGFWERYAAACKRKGVKTQTNANAEAFGVSRAALTTWKTKNITPGGNVIARIAVYLNTTADYLLELTDEIGPDLRNDEIKIPRVLSLYYSLSEEDKIRAEAYMEGLLASNKAKKQVKDA